MTQKEITELEKEIYNDTSFSFDHLVGRKLIDIDGNEFSADNLVKEGITAAVAVLVERIDKLNDKIYDLEHDITEAKGAISDLENEKSELEDKLDPGFFGGPGSEDAKRAVANDLIDNCTERELEALELLMRIKKGREYRENRIALTHPDHIDIGLVFVDLEICTSKKNNQWGRFQIQKPS